MMGGGGGAGRKLTSDGVSLPGVLSRSEGEVGASSAPSVCGIPLLTGRGGGEGLTGGECQRLLLLPETEQFSASYWTEFPLFEL